MVAQLLCAFMFILRQSSSFCSDAPHNFVHLLKYRISLAMRKPVIIEWINPAGVDKAAIVITTEKCRN